MSAGRRVLGLGLGLVLAVGPARAQAAAATNEVVVVLPIVVRGALDEPVPRTLEQRLASGLRRGAFTVIDAAAVRGRVPAGECDDACVRTVADEVKAGYAVRASVAVAGRDYDVEVVLVRASTGEAVVTSRELCEVCGHEELADRVDDLASALRRRLAAQVIVEAPARSTGPGPGPVVAPVGPQRRLAPFGWASLGVGLAAVGGGAALIAVDERPIRRDCAGMNIDAEGDCRWRRSTLEGGAVLVVAGVAAIVTGAVLVAIDRRRSGRSAARARVLPLGTGVQVRF